MENKSRHSFSSDINYHPNLYQQGQENYGNNAYVPPGVDPSYSNQRNQERNINYNNYRFNDKGNNINQGTSPQVYIQGYPQPHPQQNYITNSEFAKLSYKLMQIDNRISTFEFYNFILWIMLILSIFGLIISIFSFSREAQFFYQNENYESNFQILNFLVNMLYVIGLGYGIQAFSKQKGDMTRNFEFIIICLVGLNIVYIMIYIFSTVYFGVWCTELFYFIINALIYFQTQEITKLFEEKEILKAKYDTLRM